MKIENKIIYNHLDLLTHEEQEKAKAVFETKFPKLKRILHNDVNLQVNIKTKLKLGIRKQYFFYLKTEAASREFAISPRESDLDKLGERDVVKAATASMDHLIKIVEHRFDRQKQKKVVKKND